MKDELNTSTMPVEQMINGVPRGCFDQLDKESQEIVLTGNNIRSEKEKDSGKLGEFLGANPRNASIHCALIVCLCLLLFCLIDIIRAVFKDGFSITKDMWEYIVPIITLALGYIFGKGGEK